MTEIGMVRRVGEKPFSSDHNALHPKGREPSVVQILWDPYTYKKKKNIHHNNERYSRTI